MQGDTWGNCDNFESLEKCPHINKERMVAFIRDYIGDATVSHQDELCSDKKPFGSETLRKGEEIDKQFCSTCEDFKLRPSPFT